MIIFRKILRKFLVIRLILALITLFCLPNSRFLFAQESIASTAVVVAIIDQGVDFTHPALQNAQWQNSKESLNGIDDDSNGQIDDVSGWDFFNNTNSQTPLGPHGTRMAGIVLKQVPEAKIMSLTVCDRQLGCSSGAVVSAIYYAVDHSAKVINLSFGDVSGFSDVYTSAINYANQKGVVVVVAGGGDATGYDLAQKPISPICNKPTIGVSSVDKNGQLPVWANFGACVDVYALGVNILSSTSLIFDNASYGYFNGTSYSTAVVSGFSAKAKWQNPNITPSEIIELYKNANLIITESKKNEQSKQQSQPKVKGVRVLKSKKVVLPKPKPVAVIKITEKFR